MNLTVIDSSVFIEAILYLRKGPLENRFNVVLELIKNDLLKILELNAQIFEISYTLSRQYGLLPNDALIAATCKHYGIDKVATFDPDFKRVDFLEVIMTE